MDQKKTIKYTFVLIVLMCISFQLFAQQDAFHPFQDKSEQAIEKHNIERQIIPNKYRTVELNDDLLQKALKKAPPRFSAFAKTNTTILALPMPDGSTQHFSITEASVLHSDLAARYPEIQSFAGTGIDDPTATIRFDRTPAGFHAMVLTAKTSAVFIDPYAKGDTKNYISYYKKDYNNHLRKEFVCHVESEVTPENFIEHTQRIAGDCQLRNYRLALACTGEYAQFHGGTVNGALAAMNTSMVRVNGVFERDAGITMTIIPNNDDIIFLNGNTDPYTNGSGPAMLSENQTTIDNEIGINNYDIGHVFSTGGGGIASLRSPCGGGKARGVTGQGAPVNDPFDIDYVAHEMGHQYGGNHTFNNCGGSAGNQAYETGGATTIMGYAGICGAASNVQNNSDAYFHAINIQEFANFVTGAGNSCAEILNSSNNPPSVDAGSNYTIPRSTPFELTAEGSDPDGDNLTYCWEQFDADGQSNSPPNSTDDGPLFRSLSPTGAPNRVFPRLSDLVINTNDDWEVLPSVARNMNFICTVRDNHSAYGCTDEDEMRVTVSNNAGPFVVTYPNSNNITWLVGTQETVTWNVANTDQSPVDAANVDITMSFDGGFTYPFTIASGVANNGSYTLTVPNLVGSDNRIRVQGSGNIFFDISNRDFTIEEPPTPTFLTSVTPNNQSACKDEGSVNYQINLESVASFSEAVNFAATNVPAGATVDFSPNPVVPSGMVTMTVSGLENVAEGDYTIGIDMTSTSVNISESVDLTVLTGSPDTVTLTSPANFETGVAFTSIFSWEEADGATEYIFTIANNPMFGDSTIFETTVTETTIELSGIAPNTVFYWQVTAVNDCGAGAPSETYSFQGLVESCFVYSEDIDPAAPFLVTDNGSSTYTLNVPDNINIDDVNIITVFGHSWIGDLSTTVTSPSGTTVSLFERPGFPVINDQFGCPGDNLGVLFDDEASASYDDLENTCVNSDDNPDIVFSIEGAFQPQESLSAFNGESSSGDWTFDLSDAVQGDIGALFQLDLEICAAFVASTLSLMTNETLVVPATQTGLIDNTLLSTNAMNLNSNEIIYTITSLPVSGTLLLNGTPIGVGGLFTQEDIDNGAFTYQHNGDAATSDAFNFELQDANNGWIPNNTFNISILNNTLNASASIVNDIDCNNNNNGSIAANVTGGTMPYEYSLDGTNFQNNPTFENLSAGTYTITIRDANGFTFLTNENTITNPTVINASAAINMDVVTVTASGGTGNLMYSIDGTNFQMGNTFGGLANGDYTITVQDANGCTATTTANVAVNSLVASAIINNTVSCNGLNDGSITVDVSGGTMPLQYSINGGTSFQDSNIFDNLSPGIYEVVVLDDEGFTRTTNSVTITEPMAISVSNSVDANEMTITASGGTGTLMYSIDGINFQMSNIFSDLDNGSYTATVQDENGCTETTTGIIAVNSLVVSANLINDISCNNANDGSIEVNVGGGNEPYQYILNDGTPQSNNIFDNLAAGTYTIDVSDANGFMSTTNTITITNPTLVTASSSVDMNTVTITASGGTGTLSYSLDGTNFQNSNVFNGLANGDYTFTVQDQNGCTTTVMETVSVNTLSVIATVTNGVSCTDAADGSITATVAGGNAPFEYSLDGTNFQMSDTFENLAAGSYTVTVRDADGFEMTAATVMIVNPTAISASTNILENEITVIASGGTGNLMYSIDGTNFQSSNIFSGLANGTYDITVMDANGCTSMTTATISVNTLSVSASLTNGISCFGGIDDGVIEVSVTGGNAPYQYSLDGINFQDDPIFENLAAGSYTVTVRDADGFEMMTNMVMVTTPDAIVASSMVDQSTITVMASGGTGTLMYSIDGINFQTGNTFENLENDTYEITVMDANGCTNTSSAVVNVIPPLVVVSTVVENITCNNDNDGSISVQANGGIAPYMYSLNGGTFQSGNSFTGLAAGDYVVTIMDANGDEISSSTLTVINPETISFTIGVMDNNISISNVDGGTGMYSYSIDNGVTLQDDGDFLMLENGTYLVGVVDENGCSSFESVLIDFTNVRDLATLEFELFPNPTDGRFSVRFSQAAVSETVNIQLFDVLGQLVYQQQANSFGGVLNEEINVQHLAAGTYQLRINAASSFGIKSIVLTK